MKRNHIWLVEMFVPKSKFEPSKGEWHPTVGAYLTRAEARRYKREDWENDYPDTVFRIKKYETVSKN